MYTGHRVKPAWKIRSGQAGSITAPRRKKRADITLLLFLDGTTTSGALRHSALHRLLRLSRCSASLLLGETTAVATTTMLGATASVSSSCRCRASVVSVDDRLLPLCCPFFERAFYPPLPPWLHCSKIPLVSNFWLSLTFRPNQ